MITVKLYGLLRIDSGIRERRFEAADVQAVFRDLTALGISPKELKGCVILVNGKTASRRSKLHDGDVVQLLPPVAGG